MPKSIKLLLTENVDSLGIVGDVVGVRLGYARNFLLPRSLATAPSEEKIKELAGKRAEAQRQLAELRKHREQTTAKLANIEIDLIRSCNDQGILYGAITQQDICTALGEKGFSVKPREVRIAHTMKRIDNYDVHIKLDSDLHAMVKIHVKPDRELPRDDRHHDQPKGDTKGGKEAAADKAEQAQAHAADVKAAKAKSEGSFGGGKPETKGFFASKGDAAEAKPVSKPAKGEKKAKK